MRTSSLRWLPIVAAICFLVSPNGLQAATTKKRTLEGRLNVNTATPEELALLPGIGPVVAQRVVEARMERPFERPWELTRVKGIGAKLFRKLEPYVQTSGENTLRRDEPAKKRRGSSPRRRGPKIIVFDRPQPAPSPAEPFVGPMLEPPPERRARE